MRWVVSFALNRLFILAVLALVMSNFFRTSCGIGSSYADQLNQLFGFDQLIRALDHDSN